MKTIFTSKCCKSIAEQKEKKNKVKLKSAKEDFKKEVDNIIEDDDDTLDWWSKFYGSLEVFFFNNPVMQTK